LKLDSGSKRLSGIDEERELLVGLSELSFYRSFSFQVWMLDPCPSFLFIYLSAAAFLYFSQGKALVAPPSYSPDGRAALQFTRFTG
jgi:hypothetical protein